MYQLFIPGLSRGLIEPTNLLPRGVIITSNKNHKAPSVPRVSVLNQKLTRSANGAFALIQSTFSGLVLEKVGPLFLLEPSAALTQYLRNISRRVNDTNDLHWFCLWAVHNPITSVGLHEPEAQRGCRSPCEFSRVRIFLLSFPGTTFCPSPLSRSI